VARSRTAADGHYHFLDLANGTYTLQAALPAAGSRYGTAQAPATVTRDGTGKIKLVAADLALPPTTLKGQVTGQGAGALVMAEVRVLGSGERAFTDAQGRYVLSGIETGDRKIAVAARGFQQITPTVTLGPAGAEVTRDFTLAP
jgi:Carboxypeptidase regulatory-like domain